MSENKKTAACTQETCGVRNRYEQNQQEVLSSNIPGGIHKCINDANLTLLSMSDSFLAMFGYTREEIERLFDNKFINMIYPGDRAYALKTINHQLAYGNLIEAEYRVITGNGMTAWVLDKGCLVEDEEEGTVFYCILIDITARKKEQENLRLSLERHQIIMDQATDIIFEWDITADTLLFSPNWKKKFGYDPITLHISRNIPKSLNIYSEDIPAFVKIMKDTAAGVPYSETEFRIRDSAGRYYWSRIRATGQLDGDGRPIKAVGVIVDITTEKKEKQELLEQAQLDALTGLYNKAAIRMLAERFIAAKDARGKQALLIIDIDYFKSVNDTYGHICGDCLLSDIAGLLKELFDTLGVVGRIGGDEFMVYLPDAIDEENVRKLAVKVADGVGQIRPARESQPISCSIGAVVFDYGSADYLSLYRCADQALYYVKDNGKNGIAFYDPVKSAGSFPEGLQRSSVNAQIESERTTAVNDGLVSYVFQALYQAEDVETALNQLLEIIGRSCNVSRVYIFETPEEGGRCSGTFEWCAPGVASGKRKLKNLRNEEDLEEYSGNFNENGIFYCRDIRTLSSALYNVLAPQNIASMLQCAVTDRGRFRGFVGFDDCRDNCAWNTEQIETLAMVSRVLSVFLRKHRLEEHRGK